MKKKQLGFLLLLIIIIFSIPSLIYLLNFAQFSLSQKPEDWGTFGDYFGGVTNTLISFASLIILVYISWVVSSRESKNLYLLQKRMDAYDGVASFLPELNSMGREVIRNNKISTQLIKIDPTQAQQILDKSINVSSKQVVDFQRFHYFIFNFNPRYGHLFKFNFEAEEYKSLLSSSEKILDIMEVQLENLLKGEETIYNNKIIKEFLERLPTFLNKIRQEVI
ncbi:MAG: hypothetical protein ACI93P_001269 [bacterium]|jgi:hypothetical protein